MEQARVMDNKVLQIGVPVRLTEAVVDLQGLIKKYGIKDFSVYIGDKETDYGVILIGGNVQKSVSGIHAMVRDIASFTGKTEQEVLAMVSGAVADDVKINYT